ncbi:MAG TPA: hypothetical protein VGM87_04160 [Roseomonas sp.]|jgi:hypothetical protein
MDIVGRAWGLLSRPRRTWVEIAAETDGLRPLLTRFLPALLLPPAGLFVALQLWFDGLRPQARAVRHFRLGPDGTPVEIGGGVAVSLGGGLTVLSLLVVLGLAFAAMYGLILGNAARFGTARDRGAAFKLLAYAAIPGQIGALLMFVPFIGLLPALAGAIMTIVLFRLGAPRLLPPVAGEEARFGRAIATRALLLTLAMPVLFFIAGLLLVQVIPAAEPDIRPLPGRVIAT